MKRQLFFLVLMIIMPFASAGALFDGWVIEKSPVTLDGKNHTVRLSADKDTLFIPAFNLMINKGDCKNTPAYLICFNQTRFNFSAGQGGYDEINEKELHQARIRIERVTHEIKVERTMTNNYLTENGIETVYVKLIPEINKTVNKIVYEETLPAELKLLNGAGVEIMNNTLKAEFRNLDSNKSFSYNIKLLERKDANLSTAKITYSYNNTEKVLLPEQVMIIYSIPMGEVDQYINETLTGNKTTVNNTNKTISNLTKTNNTTNPLVTGNAVKEQKDEGGFIKYIKEAFQKLVNIIF